MSEFKMKDDNFEQLLAQHFQQAQEYISDDGFTAKVMSHIPKKQEFNPWIKGLIFWGPLFLVTILVLSSLPLLQLVHTVSAFLLSLTIKEIVLGSALSGMAMLLGYFLVSENPV